ncbi:hypothetical protein A3Q56_01737, partial [Intoshia linei]
MDDTLKKRRILYGILTTDEFIDSDPRTLSTGQIWEGFETHTSAHGIPHVYNARGPIKKTLWFLLFVAALCGLGYNLYLLINKYISYDVNVVLKLKYERNLMFPAVTLCNNNPIKLSVLKNDATFKDFSDSTTQTRKRRQEPPPTDTSEPAPTGGTEPSPDGGTEPAPDGGTGGSAEPAPDGGTEGSMEPAPDGGTEGGIEPAPDGGTMDPNLEGGTMDPKQLNEPPPEPTDEQRKIQENQQQVFGEGVIIEENPDRSEFNNFSDENFDPNSINQNLQGIGIESNNQNLPTEQVYQEHKVSFSENDIMDSPFSRGSYKDKSGRISAEQDDKRNKFLNLFDKKSLKEKEKMGYTLNEFILDCNYNGYGCMKKDFVRFFSTVNGNCFTFNSGWNQSHPVYRSYKPGNQHGLKLTLFIDQREYISQFVQAAGAKVLIHSQKIMPFPEDEGYSVQPGSLTSLAIKKTSISRQGFPYGSCVDIKVSNITNNIYEELYPIRYNTPSCLKTCLQKHLIDTCNCATYEVPKYGSAFGYRDVKNCKYTDEIEKTCMDSVSTLFNQNKLNCSCPSPCQETAYSSILSSYKWPSLKYEKKLRKDLKTKPGLDAIISDTPEKDTFSDNILKINIYYQEFNYETIIEEPSYLFFSLISDVGGILGLYIGFSAMTIFEFFELISDLFYTRVCKCSCSCVNKSSAIEPINTLEKMKKPQESIIDIDRDVLNGQKSIFSEISPPPLYNKKVIDSFGKPSSGILYEQLNMHGSIEACSDLNISNITASVEMNYCQIVYSSSAYMNPKYGMCVPYNCISNLQSNVEAIGNILNIPLPTSQHLKSFSLIHNMKLIFNVQDVNKSDKEITVIYRLRVIGALGIIYGHYISDRMSNALMDSFGKPSSGMLFGQINMLGSIEACDDMTHTTTKYNDTIEM